jgi:hypothetical protein
MEAGGVANSAAPGLSVSRAKSRGTPDQRLFFLVAPAFQLVFALASSRERGMLLCPDESDGAACDLAFERERVFPRVYFVRRVSCGRLLRWQLVTN